MYDCSKELLKFYHAEVAIDKKTRDLLRDHRLKNEERVKEGLAGKKRPRVKRFQIQGGYAMKTVVQHPKNDYDIDNGVIFNAADLKGSQGSSISALDARNMVRDAVDDGTFDMPPKTKQNCVRVYYKAGHHVDLPVYREQNDFWGRPYLELASVEWKKSDPAGVNEWFDKQVSRSPDDSDDRQFRRIVAYLKALGKSRDSWNAPSGFMFSILVSECYESSSRDDVSLVKTLRRIKTRVDNSLKVKHPVVDEYVTKGDQDVRMLFLREKLPWLLEQLAVLENLDCDAAMAAAAWDTFFKTEFFTGRLKETAAVLGVTTILSAASPIRAIRDGDRHYG